MRGFISKHATAAQKPISIGKPTVHIRSPEGHRMTVALGEISLPGPTIGIRKFAKPYDVADLPRSGTIASLRAPYLWLLPEGKAFGIAMGGTGAGKTSAINALSGLAHPERILPTVEDTPELQLPRKRGGGS